MGACVLCGKGAGLFRALHKNCYQCYQDETEELVSAIASLSQEQIDVANLANRLAHHPGTLEFTQEARQRTLIRALEKFAEIHLKNKAGICTYHTAWVRLLGHLSLPADMFIEADFLDQQFNLPAIAALHQEKLPECNFSGETDLELQTNETIWWWFEKAELASLQLNAPTKKWSVAAQLIDSWLPNKRKQDSAFDVSETWQLWISNQRLLLKAEDKFTSIAHANIYSITPSVAGITLQLTDMHARPQHIKCSDGRLLYLLTKYAQSSKTADRTSL